MAFPPTAPSHSAASLAKVHLSAVSLETKFFQLVFFLGSLRALLVGEVGVVLEVLELGPGDWVHLDWPQQTAFFGQVG